MALRPAGEYFAGTHSAAKFTVDYYDGGSFAICGVMKSSGGYRFDNTPCPAGHHFTVADVWCVNRTANAYVYNFDSVGHWMDIRWYDTC